MAGCVLKEVWKSKGSGNDQLAVAKATYFVKILKKNETTLEDPEKQGCKSTCKQNITL
jgi:hypothetical protein